MGAHVQALLDAGVSVVLDFPANTLEGRGWARSVFEKVGASHRLHFLDVPDEVCKQRACLCAMRRASIRFRPAMKRST